MQLRLVSLAVNGIGVLCAGAALAQVTGSTTPESAEQAATHAVGLAVLGVALPMVGWLLNRAIKQNDTSIKSVADKLDEVLARFNAFDTKLALIEQAAKTDHAELQNIRSRLSKIRSGG